MNGYTLTKRWYEFKFENIKRVRSVHSDLFFYIVYLWNELGQVEEFGLPTAFTMQALGIGSYNTYKKALQELVEFEFILIVSEAKNQHQSKVIALSKTEEATDKPTAKPLKRAVNNTTAKATDYIKRTTNNKLNKEQKRESNALAIEILKNENEFKEYKNKVKSKIDNWNELEDRFNNKMELEKAQNKIKFEVSQLMPRFKSYTDIWIRNQSNGSSSNSPAPNSYESGKQPRLKDESNKLKLSEYVEMLKSPNSESDREIFYKDFALKNRKLGTIVTKFINYLKLSEKHPKDFGEFKNYLYNWTDARIKNGEFSTYTTRKQVGAL